MRQYEADCLHLIFIIGFEFSKDSAPIWPAASRARLQPIDVQPESEATEPQPSRCALAAPQGLAATGVLLNRVGLTHSIPFLCPLKCPWL